jgi:hypothetical protein
VNIANLGGSFSAAGSLGNALNTNPTKYVNLDLSGSTFTSIAANAFQQRSTLAGITIPNSVTSIGNYAFLGCTSLTAVTIPASVTSIGEMACDSCTSLTSITIPAGVTSIGEMAFNSCTSLTAINVDSGNTAYSSQDGVLYNKAKTTLVYCPLGKTGAFTILDSVTTIGKALANLSGLTSVTIGSGVKIIEPETFMNCTNLASITIGSGVTSIRNDVFSGCTSLTAINVDAGNTAYSSQDGVLYNKAKTTLVYYPLGKTGAFTIPNSVTDIGMYAFAYCSSLTSVTFATGSNIQNYESYFDRNAFPEGSSGNGGNTLRTAYWAASPKAGTYTRAANGTTWTKS